MHQRSHQDPMSDPGIMLLTGGRQVGKSTALSEAVGLLRSAGVKVTGLSTQRTGPHDLSVIELHTGASYMLTDPYQNAPGSATPNFTMNEAAIARSSGALTSCFPTQVFVLDEIGPLELRNRRGWVGVLDLLKCESCYASAIIVVRPELLGEAIAELPGTTFTVVRVTTSNRQGLGGHLFDTAMVMLSGTAAPSQVMGL